MDLQRKLGRTVIAACALLGLSAPGQAVVYTRNIVIDLGTTLATNYSQSTIQADPVTNLLTGDTITGQISFANNARVTLNDVGSNEYVILYWTPSVIGPTFASTSVASLTGVQGDYVGQSPQTVMSAGCCLATYVGLGNLTNSSFSFTGLQYSLTLTQGSGSFDANQFTTTAGSIAAVPEPASWATMVAGFGVAGMALRRRRALHRLTV